MLDTITNNGKGADRLGSAKDGLKASWRWSMRHSKTGGWSRRRRIGQCCEAKLGDTPEHGDVMLYAVFWSHHYHASLEINGEPVIEYHIWPDEDVDDGEPLMTRLDAQKKAEKMGREFTKELNAVLRKFGL